MTVDRRRHVRFALTAPVSFLWEERAGVEVEGTGFTRDVSEHGAFILTDTQAPLGAGVRLEIVFHNPTKLLRMTAEGQVLRVEPSSRSEKIGGFAVATRGLDIEVADRNS